MVKTNRMKIFPESIWNGKILPAVGNEGTFLLGYD